jgi:signal transduction histidine kinase
VGHGRRVLAMLYRLGRLLAGGTDAPALLRAILQAALALTGSGHGAIFLLERESRVLRSVVHEGVGPLDMIEVAADDLPWGDAVWEGKTVQTRLPTDHTPRRGLAPMPLVILPLLARGDVLGVLTLAGEVNRLTPQGSWLETLANLAAHTLHQEARSRDLIRQQAELATLIDVGQDISASLDLDEVLKRVVRQAARLMRAKVCSLMLVDTPGATLRLRATYGASQTYTQRPPLAIQESLIGDVVRSGMPIAVLDVREHARYQFMKMARQEGLCSLLSVPLPTSTRVIGVLNVYTAERRRFRQEEVEFLSAVAAQSATAIENARLYRAMLDTQERLRHSERLAALGSMAAGLAHEIRNPLNTMQLLVYAMQQDCPPQSHLRADVEVLQSEIGRLSLLVEQFLDFARPKPPDVQQQKLHEIMEETLLVVSAEAKQRRITLRKHWPRELPAVGVDGAQLKQVFLNILLNALQAMASDGTIDVHMHADDTTITTIVRDQGIGIPAEVQPQLFTPFFTTKPQGTGLGLSISQRIVEGHGGCIRVTSRQGEGTAVHIVLPLTPSKGHETDLTYRR